MEKKIVEFNGKEYERSANGRYYFEKNTKYKERTHCTQLHRAVWEYYNGEIPKGYQIHHKDGNIDNNDISNLECVSAREHLSYHSKKNWQNKEYRERMADQMRGNSERQQKCKEWHRSEEGRKWHREQAKRSILKNKFREERICEWCGKQYTAKMGAAKYCSVQCQRKACNYRKEQKCIKCGKEFHSTTAKRKYCSIECRKKYKKENTSI